ncbi:MAG: capsule biosynthesis protein [Hyphomicrobiaceae bacterium]
MQNSATSPPRAVELVPVGQSGQRRPRPEVASAMRRAAFRRHLVFGLMVVLPTLATAIYLLLFAASRYEAEARFVVRSPSNGAASQLASLMQGTTIVRSADDAYIVHAYLNSPDILRRLVSSANLLELLARPEADFLWRYPLPFLAHNEERLRRHMQWMINVDYEYTSGISTLKVQAFRPEDAKALAEAMLAESELLINRLSERAQTDAIATAEREVELTRRKAREMHARVTDFRHRVGMIDPGHVSKAAFETISKLALEMAQTNAQLAEVEKASPQSTQISSLRYRLTALDSQIKAEQKQLAGSDTSLAPLIAEYERLSLEREFAERTFASALTTLEAARLDTQRQRLFLERIAAPAKPDYARYPSRLLSVLGVLAICWMIHGILGQLVRDAISHAER